MNAIELLKKQAEMANAEMLEAIDGVSEAHAWAVAPQGSADYLHTDGSIQGIILHVAGCRFMYASCAFRNQELTWRDIAARMDAFEPSWPAAVDFLHESHGYFLASFADLTAPDLEKEFGTIWGKMWPAWRIIARMIEHDAYHAGQIQVVRYAAGESDTPPASTAADIRNCCTELPSW